MTTTTVESNRFYNINDIHMFCYEGGNINLHNLITHISIKRLTTITFSRSSWNDGSSWRTYEHIAVRIYVHRGIIIITISSEQLGQIEPSAIIQQHVFSGGNVCFTYLEIKTKIHFYFLRLTGFER